MNERTRRRIDGGGTCPVDPVPEPVRDQQAGAVRTAYLQKQIRGAPPNGERGGDHEPNESLAADPGQAFEHRVEPADPMVDGPALEPAVVAQAGSSCLAC